MSELLSALAKIQQNLKVPKGQTNNFGKYKYRNCEDILQALTPLLGDCVLTLSDDIVMMGDRFYIKASAGIQLGTDQIVVTGWAREDLTKKGMDVSQLTGSTSSYARKYALNGLFAIDDTKDADSMDNRQQEAVKKTVKLKSITPDEYWAQTSEAQQVTWNTLDKASKDKIMAANNAS